MNVSTKQIGDGKLPNKYWVSISNDYLYFNSKHNAWDWISDLQLVTPQSKALVTFPTFKEAIEFTFTLPFQNEYQNIQINTIVIEDRLSGEVYEKTLYWNPLSGLCLPEERIDIEFTKKAMEERGAIFI